MQRSRRIAAAASAAAVVVAGGITAFAITATNAGAQTAASCTTAVPTSSANPSPAPGVTPSPVKASVTCNKEYDGIATPANVYLVVSTTDSTGVGFSVSWATNCVDSSGNDIANSGTWTATAASGSAAPSKTLTIPAQSQSCNAKGTLTASMYPSDSIEMDIDYTAQASASPTATATPSPTATSGSGSSSAGGLSKGFKGKCLDDAKNSSSLRATVQIWNCNNGDKAQKFSYSGGEVKHNGLCLNAKGSGNSGSKVILWTCTGTPNEIWVFNTLNHQVLLKAHGFTLCLNDPGYSTRNGTQLIVYKCQNTPNEHWTVP